MANVGAFIQVLEQFLDELTQTFPDQPRLKKYKATFDLLRKANPRKIMESFIDSAKPYADKIMAMDETFFLNSDVGFLNDLDIKKWWTPDLSPATKQSIWQFLQYLLITGGVAAAMPQIPQMTKDVQNQIETLAKSIPQPQDGQAFDLNSIPMDAVMNIAKQVQPDADISEEHVKQAMGMVKNLLDSQGGGSPEDLMQNMLKSMGGNFSK
jgi:hypothetical protein